MSEHAKRAIVSSSIGALVGALLAIGAYVMPLNSRLAVLESRVEDLRLEVREMRQGVPLNHPATTALAAP